MEVNFLEFVSTSSRVEISEKRKSLLSEIDGDLFYSINLWPKKIERIFWNKPISDQETFVLLIFLVENGCPPCLARQWILTSTFWDKAKTSRRHQQIEWILENRSKKINTWFYFDLHFQKYVYLDGTDRCVNAENI